MLASSNTLGRRVVVVVAMQIFTAARLPLPPPLSRAELPRRRSRRRRAGVLRRRPRTWTRRAGGNAGRRGRRRDTHVVGTGCSAASPPGGPPMPRRVAYALGRRGPWSCVSICRASVSRRRPGTIICQLFHQFPVASLRAGCRRTPHVERRGVSGTARSPAAGEPPGRAHTPPAAGPPTTVVARGGGANFATRLGGLTTTRSGKPATVSHAAGVLCKAKFCICHTVHPQAPLPPPGRLGLLPPGGAGPCHLATPCHMSHFLKRLRTRQLCEAPLFVKDLNVVQEALASVQNALYSAEALKAAGQPDTLHAGWRGAAHGARRARGSRGAALTSREKNADANAPVGSFATRRRRPLGPADQGRQMTIPPGGLGAALQFGKVQPAHADDGGGPRGRFKFRQPVGRS